MESIWQKSCPMPRFSSLGSDCAADVAVIGGGLAGLLTAYFLQEQGLKVLVLEAGRIGGGQTGKTTAKITAQHGPIYGRIQASYGPGFASLYAKAMEQAIVQYRNICDDLQISCDLETRDAYLYSVFDRLALEEEAEAALNAGLPVELMDEVPLPLSCVGALRLRDQAQFHPLKFLKGLASHLRILEDTSALSVSGSEIRTPGGVVRAQHIVFACHYPICNVPGLYFTKMHQSRSYVLALEGAPVYDGMYYPMEPGGLSFRSYGSYLLLGGQAHRTGKNEQGGQFAALETAAHKLFPDCRVAARWSAQDCMTPDGIPYVGKYGLGRPNWYVATGFNKWGMTGAMAAAETISDLIVRGSSPYEKLFSRRRFSGTVASATLSELSAAVRGLSQANFCLPAGTPEGLLPDTGGVISQGRKQVCGYRTREGHLYILSARCPHLGCRLNWNPEERSWDCPCHGIRVSYTGKLLDSPSKSDAKIIQS